MENKFELENELVVTSKQTLDILLKQENPGQLIALYIFYYYTAEWQHTNQPKATIEFCAKGLKWGVEKTRSIKGKLIDLGLIQDIKKVNSQTKRVEGWYVKIKYFWNHPMENQEGGFHPTDLPGGGSSHSVESRGTNALESGILNALKTGNEMLPAQKIFELWNSKGIIAHRKLTGKIETKIKAALKDYSFVDITAAIANYSEIITHPDKYWWTHKWTLDEFLVRGLTKFLETPLDNFLKEKKEQKPFYKGMPMQKFYGRWKVLDGGEWKEYNDKESLIEYK